MGLTYKDAGVDKEKGYEEVKLIKKLVERTKNPGVMSDIGGFAGLYGLSHLGFEEPVLVSGTDGVGTKLKLAFMMDKHDTVGIDAVAMCVNDILCTGAVPIFFLDYIATGKLIPEKMAQIVSGIAEGCVASRAALIGGETAEMPGVYDEDEYDIAGFAVGCVDRKNIIDGSKISSGDVIIGLPSSGCHSNGFSLIRKIAFEVKGYSTDTYIDELGKTLGEELITPTRIYVEDVMPAIEAKLVKGMCHITGGGFYENLPRLLKDYGAKIDSKSFEVPKIFRLLQQWGDIKEDEMYGTFNMGVGMVLVVGENDVDALVADFNSRGVAHSIIGTVVDGGEIEIC